MECLERRGLHNFTKEGLLELSADMIDKEIYKKILKNWDTVAKPIDSMGKFEKLTARIGAMTGAEEVDISKKAVIIMCADNGIVEEGISQSGQEITAAVARQMAKKASSVGKMASLIKSDTIAVDIGINSGEKIDGVLERKIRCGTSNFAKEPAMTEDEAVRAIFTGIEIVALCKENGYRMLATGEMGIGNTTTSSAVAAALLGCDVAKVTGRGAGLSDEKLLRKRQIIKEALEKYKLVGAEPLRILAAVGGFDIAGLAGVCIGGAVFHMPIVLDGAISLAAALLAEKIMPGTVNYMTASHKGKEPACAMLLNALALEPVIYADMALGEGTGAVMMFALLDLATSIYRGRTTFEDMKIEQYERFT